MGRRGNTGAAASPPVSRGLSRVRAGIGAAGKSIWLIPINRTLRRRELFRQLKRRIVLALRQSVVGLTLSRFIFG